MNRHDTDTRPARQSRSRSRLRRWPWGLIGMLGLIVASEEVTSLRRAGLVPHQHGGKLAAERSGRPP